MQPVPLLNKNYSLALLKPTPMKPQKQKFSVKWEKWVCLALPFLRNTAVYAHLMSLTGWLRAKFNVLILGTVR